MYSDKRDMQGQKKQNGELFYGLAFLGVNTTKNVEERENRVVEDITKEDK